MDREDNYGNFDAISKINSRSRRVTQDVPRQIRQKDVYVDKAKMSLKTLI